MQALHRVQEEIPERERTIPWDLPGEIGMLENDRER